MDARLQHLADLIQQGIEEAVKTVREQEKEEHRLRECVKLIKKLRGEISSEQKELNAERKKAAALTARSKKLDRDMQLWQEKLDHFVSQAKEMKSHYVGKMGAEVVDLAVEDDESLVIASLPVVDSAVDLTHVLPVHVPEHECDTWIVDSAQRGDHRDPTMLPPMQSVKNGDGREGSPKKGTRGRKRKVIASESDSEDAPKKRVVRKRIVDADGIAAKLSSEFKRECVALLNSREAPAGSNDEADAGNGAETAQDWQSAEEIAVITAPRPGQPLDLRCASHMFCPKNIITVPRRFNQKDFESKMKLIQSCANLRIFCMFGLDQRLQQLAIDTLTESLAQSCPRIEHFILDDGLLDIAIAYQESLPDSIRVLEFKNEQESEDDLIHLIKTSNEIHSVYLKHSSVKVIEQIVPRVKSLSLCWITDHEFKSLIKCAGRSHISELMLETVDLTMDAVTIGQLASALPDLRLLKLSAPLQHIYCLQEFRSLRHVVFDAECPSKQTIDPDFPIDMRLALELSRKQDQGNEPVIKEEEEDEGISQQSLSCQIGLDKFFASCGPTLSSFSITIREKFKKDFFHDLKRGCPVLQELTILSTTEQFFDPKSLSLPSLKSLSLQFISISDAKLIEVLDSCRNLNYISIDKPRKITISCINVLYYYGQEVFSHRQLTSDSEKFTAIILTEGREDLSKCIRTDRMDITFKQKAVAEISNRLRYKY